jgi:agmatine deiminase
MHRSDDSNLVVGTTPAPINHRMPAEWEPHAATWLAWPHYQGDWPGKFEPIPWVYTEIIRNLARHERVELIVNNAAAEKQARKLLERSNALLKNIQFHRWPTNRSWLRDSGCIFVEQGSDDLRSSEVIRERAQHRGRAALQRHVSPSKLHGALALAPDREGRDPSASLRASLSRAVDDSYQGTASAVPPDDKRKRALAPEGNLQALTFRFNAWAKYSNHGLDQKIGTLMSQAARSQQILPQHNNTRVVLEGGSIDVNGQGTVLTTEECLLSKIQQRNPTMQRKDYEKLFANYLGAPHTIWLGKGIAGDDTHGHVDDLTRFVRQDTVVTVVEKNRKDINHKPLTDNLRRLKSATDQAGKPLNVIELPMPKPVIFEQRRLPASYANFYIANGVVLVPVFNDANDREALNTLSEIFPAREIVPIYSGDLIWGLGTLHCMTQQQPSP